MSSREHPLWLVSDISPRRLHHHQTQRPTRAPALHLRRPGTPQEETVSYCARCNQQRPLDPSGHCQTCARKLAGLCACTFCDRPHARKDRYCHGHRRQLQRHGTLTPLRGRGPRRKSPPWTRAELLTEVQHLIGTDMPASIARRLGYADPEGLYRALGRMATEYPEAARLKARLVAQAQDEADLLRHVSGCWERRAA